MGLFSKKKKVTIEDMSMQMMLAAGNVVGKLKSFNDLTMYILWQLVWVIFMVS